MNAKKITTLVLLLFVLASVGVIVTREAGTTAEQETAVETVSEKAVPVKVVAYYFHGNKRCYTCRMIEALTTEAIETGFADDIRNGRIEMKSVNVEEAGNDHYVQDYQLSSRSVVVARYENGAQKEWKRLDEVWQLVRDRDAFIRFVQEQTANLLKGQPS